MVRNETATLTGRERQVFERLLLGETNKEMAIVLGISRRTVEDHRCQVMKKFKVRNAVELVRAVYKIQEFGPEAAETMEPAE
jgi:FixJ family two-component response regulator